MRKPIQVIRAQRLQRLLNANKIVWRGRKTKPVVVDKTEWHGNPFVAIWLLDYSLGIILVNRKDGWQSAGIPWVGRQVLPTGPCTHKAAMDAVKHVLWKGRKNRKRIIKHFLEVNKRRPKNMSFKEAMKFEREQSRKGETTMAKAKAKAKKKSKKKTHAGDHARASSIGGRGAEGKTMGLGIGATWVKVFENNAKAPKRKRMTDEEITKFMFKEFGGGPAYFNHPQGVRRQYNAGQLVGQDGPPKVESVPYDEDGNAREVRSGRGAAAATPKRSKKKTKVKAKAKARKKTRSA